MITKLLLTILLLAAPLDAQTFVLVGATDSVRKYLADRWDETDPAQTERAFCAAYVLVRGIDGEPFAILTGVDSAETLRTFTLADGRRGVVSKCPANTAHGHSHPPSSPNPDGTFSLGGVNANICGPSVNDLRNLKRTGALFLVIQCDRRALVAVTLYGVWPKP